jgi:hypothetical protein
MIGREVDFLPCGVEQRYVDMLKVFRRGIVDDWRGIGAALRAKGEKRRDGYGSPEQVHASLAQGAAFP